ncbi:MAG: hypothetical protein ACTTG8_08560 [Catonella sp.]|uniref:hypothetical protein n=1 Tax=Catonella sp. TaxID=2382125 RepID=UPI003FA01F64
MGENELNAKELYKLTESLYDENIDSLKWLLNKKNKGKLDKSKKAILSYKEYNNYKEKSEHIIFLDAKDKVICLKGEVLNAFNQLFRKYINSIKTIEGEVKESEYYIDWDKTEQKYSGVKNEIEVHMFTRKIGNSSNECSQKIQISNLAKMYFHLTTTVGNVMPWLNGFNPNGGLDIVQYKFPKCLGLYEWIKFVGNEQIGDENEDEKEKRETHGQNERKEWIRNFVDNHYLQDFVFKNNGSFEAIKFLDLDTLEDLRNKLKEEKGKKAIEEIWNLYFYRASKAIMKRSYRILTKKNLNEDDKGEFDKAFIKFCKECEIEKELIALKTYLVEHKEQEIKNNEIGELEELINKLGDSQNETTN